MVTLPSFFSEKNSVESFLSYLGPLESRGLLSVSFDKTSPIWKIFQNFLDSYLKTSPFYDTHALFLEYQERNKTNPAKTTPLFVRNVKHLNERDLFLNQLNEWQKKATSTYGADNALPDRVEAGVQLAKEMHEAITERDYLSKPQTHVYYVVDAKKEMQAYLMYLQTPQTVTILHLVSAPTNNDPNNTNARVSGAASALIEQIIFRAIEKNGLKIKLRAMIDAIPFYRRLHFESHEEDPKQMQLAGDPIQKFLKQFGGRALLAEI